MLTFLQFLEEERTPKEIANNWREHTWDRSGMSKLAKKAVKGGPLHHLHPGNITLHRGVTSGSASHRKVGTAWSKAKTVAHKYADGGKVHSMQINPHIPAIDVNKLLKGTPSKSSNDREVFVAKGKYKTSTK
jgi:hypothetical protein